MLTQSLADGRRSGEKLHEVMITAEESYDVDEFSSYYVIQPPGRVIPSREPPWIYASNINDWWMSRGELKRHVEDESETITDIEQTY